MTTFFRLLDSAADATAAQGGWLSTLLTFLPFVLLIVVFYFMLIRRRKSSSASWTRCAVRSPRATL